MIRKAVIPVAGYATRMLPATKVLPKSMLSIANKPVIEYLIDEIIDSGIKDILLVTNSYSTILQEHFSRNYELEYFLKNNKNLKLLSEIKNRHRGINLYLKRASTNKSLANSIYDSKDFVKDEAFLLVLGDEILGKNSHCSKKLVEKYNETNNQIIAVKEVPEEIKSNYGIIEGEEVTENLYLINKMIEKPKKEDTDSQLAIIGRYVLNSSIFDTLQKELENKTYDFTKAIYKNKGDKYALKINDERFDCGSKLGLIKANIHFGLKDEEIGKDVFKYISNYMNEINSK